MTHARALQLAQVFTLCASMVGAVHEHHPSLRLDPAHFQEHATCDDIAARIQLAKFLSRWAMELYASGEAQEQQPVENLEVKIKYVFPEHRMPGIIDETPFAEGPDWDERPGRWALLRYRGPATNEGLARMLEAKAAQDGVSIEIRPQLRQIAQQLRKEPVQIHQVFETPGNAEHYSGLWWDYRNGDQEVLCHVAVRPVYRYVAVQAKVNPPTPAVWMQTDVSMIIRQVKVWEE